MKKTLVLLLTIILLIAFLAGCNNTEAPNTTDNVPSNTVTSPNSSPTPNPASDFEYKENDNGGITITRYIGHDSDVIIPDTIKNKPITQIGIDAFRFNIAKSVSMPNTITKIEDRAFYQCSKLESITLSKNLIEIGFCAFQECNQLKQITIPSMLKSIGDMAFDSSGLETVVFEEGIEVIGGYGSFACTQIKQLVLPSTVKEIGLSTFAANPKLETVLLNEGLVTIGHKAFVNNPKLKEIVIPKTVEFVTEMDFNMCSGLEKIMFEGNAPATFEHSDEISGVWKPYNVKFTIYYHEGAEGFTSPEWYGYPTEIW